jgi:hypothetical protein
MKFAVTSFLLAAALPVVASEIRADSTFGQHMMEHARRLNDNQEEQDVSAWVSSYSLKFQGCFDVKQWNDEADGEDDVRIATKSLVRFRMCPSDSCSSSKAAGCTAGFGDYVISMDTFMQGWFEAVAEQREAACQEFFNSKCNCDKDNNQGDDFNEEYCEYNCFLDNDMAQCVDRNPYEENGEENDRKFDIDEYMECKEIELPNNDNQRKLQDNEEEVRYYVGPYCGNQGGSIHLGLFTDDTCTQKASGVTFEELMGFALPYETSSLVDAACVSCLEPVEQDQNNANDAADADNVMESCENLYMYSGKCEANLPAEMVASPNNNACNFMEGIKIVRQDGIIDVGVARKSAVATSFTVIFAMAFCAMAFYVWYLRTRLGVKKDTLLG